MNRKQINKIVEKTSKRRIKTIALITIIVTLLMSTGFCFLVSIYQQKNYYVHYDENSNLDYKVYLKPNEYFGEYLGKDKQYIASLINYIEANFKYDLKVYEDIDFSYNYYINANVSVLDSNGKALYQKTDEVLPLKVVDADKHSFKIDETVKLDYNYYNKIIEGFINKYNLTNVTSNVTLKMYVGLKGDCKQYNASIEDDAVISMTIPLSTNTVNVDMNYVLTNGTDKLLECENVSVLDNILFTVGSILLAITIVLTIYVIIYLLKTRSYTTIYNQKLRGIFSNYGRYISKIKAPLNNKKYECIPVDDFEDLIEIRNCTQSPILCITDEEKLESTFEIPTSGGLLYVYILSIEEIGKGDIDD